MINNSSKIGGAEISLYNLLKHLPHEQYRCSLIIPAMDEVSELLGPYVADLHCVKNLVRIRRTSSFAVFFSQLCSFVNASIRIALLINKLKPQIIYANSAQAVIYCLFPKICTGKKLVWHCRDNVQGILMAKMVGLLCNKIICCLKNCCL